MNTGLQQAKPSASPFRRFIPLVVLIAGLVAFFAFGLDRYVTFQALKENRAWLLEFVTERPAFAALIYGAAYVAMVAFSLPGGAVMSIAGGFLFGAVLGSTIIVAAATMGATLVFLAAKTALGDVLRKRAGPFLKRMEEGFRENALNYLLVLRLVPLFPFFIVNLVPAFLGVSLRVFVLASFFGMIPGTFVYASVGAGLGSIFDAGEEFSAKGILTPEIGLALAGLAVLALVPVAYKAFKARRAKS